MKSTREKEKAAASSLVVAIALTSMKAIVGILTNSLGILSEALHSGLDLVAAATTLYAVRISGKPPDRDHHYGHGKYESFSALVEVLLLLGTCAWVSYEALQRLLFRQVEIEASLASFAVMLISIVLDYSRSRILYRTAKKYNSQALEADALHFRTDIMSSSVVILGLIFVSFGYRVADPLAALGVVVVVVALSLRLGVRTVEVLLDRAPEGLSEKIRAQVVQIQGIRSAGRIRIRPSGPQTFIELEVFLDRAISLERVNAVVVEVERAIRNLVPFSDIMVRTTPVEATEKKFVDEIRTIASRIQGIQGIHEIETHDSEQGLHVEMHLEVDPNASLGDAHEISSRLESAIKNGISGVAEVVTHIEPPDAEPVLTTDVTSESYRIVREIRETAREVTGVKSCRDIAIHSSEDGLHLTLTCVLEQNLSVSEAHGISTLIEEALRKKIKSVARVLIHVEPYSG